MCRGFINTIPIVLSLAMIPSFIISIFVDYRILNYSSRNYMIYTLSIASLFSLLALIFAILGHPSVVKFQNQKAKMNLYSGVLLGLSGIVNLICGIGSRCPMTMNVSIFCIINSVNSFIAQGRGVHLI